MIFIMVVIIFAVFCLIGIGLARMGDDGDVGELRTISIQEPGDDTEIDLYGFGEVQRSGFQ